MHDKCDKVILNEKIISRALNTKETPREVIYSEVNDFRIQLSKKHEGQKNS